MKHINIVTGAPPFPRARATRWLGVISALVLITGCASGNSAQGGAGGSGGSSSGAKTSMWGYVYAVTENNDTVKVKLADVYTEPASDLVKTDSLGYWEIKEGVVENKYRVMAKFDGVTGRTPEVPIRQGEATKIDVIMGAAETAWPPTIKPDNKGVFIPGGIPIRR